MNTTQQKTNPSTEATARPMAQILETLESAVRAQISVQHPRPSSYSRKMLDASDRWRANWIKQRLGLSPYHPDVKKLENAVWQFCVGFAQNPSFGKRMVIYGNNGNGKSKCCKSVRRWIQDRAIDLPLALHDDQAALPTCFYCHWPAQLDRLKNTQDWDIDPLIEADLLLLDDLGAEHDPSRVGLEKIYLILEERERRWTIITTNSPPEFWEEKFERRVADRLFRNCEHVDLSQLPSYALKDF